MQSDRLQNLIMGRSGDKTGTGFSKHMQKGRVAVDRLVVAFIGGEIVVLRVPEYPGSDFRLAAGSPVIRIAWFSSMSFDAFLTKAKASVTFPGAIAALRIRVIIGGFLCIWTCVQRRHDGASCCQIVSARFLVAVDMTPPHAGLPLA
jgi:hypothetical protein